MTWKAYLGVLALSCSVTALWGCGEDPEDHGQSHHDGGDHHHDAGPHHDGGHHHPDASDEDLIKHCRDNLPAFEPGLEQLGSEERIRARLVSADPSALRKGANDLVFDFLTADGEAVTDLEVKRAWTYMPIHDHNGTFMPEETPEETPGRWKFTGFYFTMRGPWQVRLELDSPTAGADTVVIEVCVGR